MTDSKDCPSHIQAPAVIRRGAILRGYRGVSAAMACGLAVVVAAYLLFNGFWIGGHPLGPQTSGQKAALPACAAFSEEEQSCTFGSTISWANTGNVPNLLPCIIPLPPHGDYVLWQGDGISPPVVWSSTTPLPVVNVYGFQSSRGTQTVRYKLVQFADQCIY